jgi:hypothetical protein
MYDAFIAISCLIVLLIGSHIFLQGFYEIGVIPLLYLIVTRQLSHYIEKRKLVVGDLIFIKYRGKYRKAFITHLSSFNPNSAQIQFLDKELNIDLVKHNWYPLSRIVIPEFMGGKVAKILFSDSEDL